MDGSGWRPGPDGCATSRFPGSLTTFSTWVVEAVRAGLDGDRRWPLLAGVELLGRLMLGVAVAVAALVLAAL